MRPISKRTSDSRLSLNGLDLSSTYYWQVAEINELAAIEAWEGPLWSFNTRSYITIDDFEAYDNALQSDLLRLERWCGFHRK